MFAIVVMIMLNVLALPVQRVSPKRSVFSVGFAVLHLSVHFARMYHMMVLITRIVNIVVNDHSSSAIWQLNNNGNGEFDIVINTLI